MRASANKEWFLKKGGVCRGPLNLIELRSMMSRGQVMAEDLIWREGQGAYMPILSVEDVYPFLGDLGWASSPDAPTGAASAEKASAKPIKESMAGGKEDAKGAAAAFWRKWVFSGNRRWLIMATLGVGLVLVTFLSTGFSLDERRYGKVIKVERISSPPRTEIYFPPIDLSSDEDLQQTGEESESPLIISAKIQRASKEKPAVQQAAQTPRSKLSRAEISQQIAAILRPTTAKDGHPVEPQSPYQKWAKWSPSDNPHLDNLLKSRKQEAAAKPLSPPQPAAPAAKPELAPPPASLAVTDVQTFALPTHTRKRERQKMDLPTAMAVRIYRRSRSSLIACDELAERRGEVISSSRVVFRLEVDRQGNAKVGVGGEKVADERMNCYQGVATHWRVPTTGEPYKTTFWHVR